MRSSISSSDGPVAWRRFFRRFVTVAGGLALFVYLFIVTVDPWDILPLSPPLPRVPISTNARFSFPALARSPSFDSAIIGTSTFRMLRPATLDTLLGTHFVNLSMNSATPYEQTQLLGVFLRRHPHPDLILIGLDAGWCSPAPARTTPRPFPEWMYGRTTWQGYFAVFNLYAVQEAASQFAVMIGLKRPPFGRDGYTSFLPDDASYDATRARLHLVEDRAPATMAEPSAAATVFPAHAMLAGLLDGISPPTRTLLVFAPYYIGLQGAPGSQAAADLAACKARVRALAAAHPGIWVVDFMIPSPITTVAQNYWDPRHYRISIAEQLAEDLAAIAQGGPPRPGDAEVVAPAVD